LVESQENAGDLPRRCRGPNTGATSIWKNPSPDF
jgi:hypothetical protein